MRHLQRVTSWVVAGSILAGLVTEAAEAATDPLSQYDQITLADDWDTAVPPPESSQDDAGSPVVGRIPGTGGVSPRGGATYSIPLHLPPGINGMTPSLSIEYRHQETGGTLGVGWFIGGTSAISRCPRTIAQDGEARPVTQSASDRFCLDQSRLVVVNGRDYGSAGAEYRTELESFARIRSYGTAGSGPQSFTVELADGRILEYGVTADSRIDWAGNSITPRAWALSRIRDRSGNSIDLSYAEDSNRGSYRLASVRFGGNPSAGVAHAHEVAFAYDARPATDADLRYVAGAAVLQTFRLARIDVMHRGALMRRYELGYEPALSAAGHSRLATIRECGRQAVTCLPPTLIAWQDGKPGLGAEQQLAASLGAVPGVDEAKRAWAADINGDGRDDLVWVGGGTPGTIRYRLATGSGAPGVEIDTGVRSLRGAGVPIDYDADGLVDVLIVSEAGRWLVLRGTTTGLGAAIDSGITDRALDFRGADLDGDGLSDLVYSERTPASGEGLAVRVRYNRRGGGFSGSSSTLYERGPIADPDAPHWGSFLGRAGQRIDLDNDGREDLLMTEGTALARISADQSTSDRFDGLTGQAVAADVNGDGCTDVAYPHNTGRWRVRFSGCSVTSAAGTEVDGPTHDPSSGRVVAFDWNGDGREDLLQAGTSPTWQATLSAGAALLPTMETGVAHGTPTVVVVADLNGDELPDLVTGSNSRLAYRLRHGPVPDLLLSVTDGLGGVTRFGYGPLTDPAVHAKGSGAAWPLQDAADGPPVVTTLMTGVADAPQTQVVRTYSYTGLRTDLAGRGDLGFAHRLVKEVRPDGLSIEEDYRQAFPFTGRLERTVSRARSGRVMGEENYSWKVLTLGSGAATRRHVYAATQTTRMYDADTGTDPVTTSTITVDSVDALSGIVVDGSTVVTGGPGSPGPGGVRTERTRHQVVLNDTTGWCIGRPQSTTVTASHDLPGGAAITHTSAVTWDATACRAIRMQREPGDPSWQVTVDLAYDAFGNVARRTATGVGMTPRVESFSWGAQGRFPERLANPLAQATSLSWDEGLGRLLAVTDPNGLRRTIEYDGLGRPLAETLPDGRRLEWRMQACGDTCDGRARVRRSETESSITGEKLAVRMVDVDALGRALRVVTRPPGGGESQESVDLDAKGRVLQWRLPGWVGGQPGGTWRFDYDERGRVSSEILYGTSGSPERQFSHAYLGLVHTLVDGSERGTSVTTNPWGDVVEVRDALGGATRYDYDATGHLLTVRDPGDVTLARMSYSPYGMKLTHADADLGTWSFQRNALGEMTAQRDAKGQEARYDYDLLGRMTRRVESEGVTAWSWGTSAASRNIGRLASVTGPGYAETYAYDGLSRLARRGISADGLHQYDYAYDAGGRLVSLTYPASVSGFRLKLGYEYDGHRVVRIRDLSAQGELLWELTASDARGNVLDESRGGRVRVLSGYSTSTGAPEFRQSLVGGLSVQDVTYRWDSSGNLVERHDAGVGSLETFSHDPVGRLEQANRNGLRDLALRYDAAGNVTWKSDICPSSAACFTYDASRRHAVTGAGAGRFAYDANGNMTGRNGSSISWTSYNLPSVINHGSSQAKFWYGPARNRWKQVAAGPEGPETTLYVGGLLEKVTRGTKTSWRHYLQAPTGTLGVHVRDADGGAPRTYLLTQDHLGGTSTILDRATGATVAKLSFDPFGRRRSGTGTGIPASAETAAISAVTRDGYTGHEHLDNVGLIHMGGRVYDPIIARFLSPDPVVSSPFNRQDLNRYAYAWNGPLAVVDPNGLEEVTCVHGPNGRCQGVTVTGYRDRPPGGAAYFMWRTGSNGQAASAEERDPCGQDGSAAACNAYEATEDPSASAVSGLSRVFPAPVSDLGRAGLNLIPGWYYSGAAASMLQRGNYLDAALLYGAMAGDVFLLGRGLAMAQASRSLGAPVQAYAAEAYGPTNPGPLAERIASTFRSGSYSRRTLQEPLLVYRLIGQGGNPAGRFWTTLEPKGALQSVIDLAIDQNWRNPATQVIRAEIPAGTVIYEGATSAQRGLVGGAQQVYVPRVDPGWLR